MYMTIEMNACTQCRVSEKNFCEIKSHFNYLYIAHSLGCI